MLERLVDQIRDDGRGMRSLACAMLVRTARDLRGCAPLQRYDALRFCIVPECNGVFTFWSDASGLGMAPAEMRRRLLKLLPSARGRGKYSMDQRKRQLAFEKRVKELEGLAQTIVEADS